MSYDPIGVLADIESTVLDTSIVPGAAGHIGDSQVLADAHNKLASALTKVSDGSFINPRARGGDATGATLSTSVLLDCITDMTTGSVMALIGGIWLIDDILLFDGLIDAAVLFLGARLKLADDTLDDASNLPVIRTTDCERLLLWHPRIDGNRAGQTDNSQFNAGIEVGIADHPCSETILDDPRVWNTAGDCVTVRGGSVDTHLLQGKLKDPNDVTGENRQGLGLVSADGVYVDGTVFAATGIERISGRMAIDIEPNNEDDVVTNVHLDNVRQYGTDWTRLLSVSGGGGEDSYGEVFLNNVRGTRTIFVDPPEPLERLELQGVTTDEAWYLGNINVLKVDTFDIRGPDVAHVAGALIHLADAPRRHGYVNSGSAVNEGIRTTSGIDAGIIVEGAAKRLDIDDVLMGGSGAALMSNGIVVRAKDGTDPIEVNIGSGNHYFMEGTAMGAAVDLSGLAGAGNNIHVAPEQHWFRSVTAPLVGGTKALNQPMSRTFKGTLTWNPGSIADGDDVSVDVTLAGLLNTDVPVASFSSITTSGWLISATVINATSVRVTILNRTGGAVDLPSGTLTVVVFRPA